MVSSQTNPNQWKCRKMNEHVVVDVLDVNWLDVHWFGGLWPIPISNKTGATLIEINVLLRVYTVYILCKPTASAIWAQSHDSTDLYRQTGQMLYIVETGFVPPLIVSPKMTRKIFVICSAFGAIMRWREEGGKKERNGEMARKKSLYLQNEIIRNLVHRFSDLI